MNFNNVKALHIPEGDVIRIQSGDTVLWEKYFEQTASGEIISLNNSINGTISGLSLFGKSTQNGTPTPTSPIPIENIVNPTIRTTGKNLFNATLTKAVTQNGVTCTPLGDGTFKLNGAANAVCWFRLTDNFTLDKGTYTIYDGTTTPKVHFFDDGHVWGYDYVESNTKTITKPALFKPYIVVAAGTTLNNVIFKPMLVMGDTVDITYYEPYKSGGSATINRTLCGIGDVKDELIVNKDGTGKFVQRINTIVLDGVNRGVDRCQVASSGEYAALIEHLTGTQQGVLGVHMLNSHFITNAGETLLGQTYLTYYGRTIVLVHPDQSLTTPALWNNWLAEQNTAGTPVTIQYELATPIETDLTAEEVSQILALKTFEPCTVVQNDKGAEMTVRYVGTHKGEGLI